MVLQFAICQELWTLLKRPPHPITPFPSSLSPGRGKRGREVGVRGIFIHRGDAKRHVRGWRTAKLRASSFYIPGSAGLQPACRYARCRLEARAPRPSGHEIGADSEMWKLHAHSDSVRVAQLASVCATEGQRHFVRVAESFGKLTTLFIDRSDPGWKGGAERAAENCAN